MKGEEEISASVCEVRIPVGTFTAVAGCIYTFEPLTKDNKSAMAVSGGGSSEGKSLTSCGAVRTTSALTELPPSKSPFRAKVYSSVFSFLMPAVHHHSEDVHQGNMFLGAVGSPSRLAIIVRPRLPSRTQRQCVTAVLLDTPVSTFIAIQVCIQCTTLDVE
ncbi:hypothetical protein BOTBODRAFT_322990 [Botryobasidium botryosum FD-172 SS1]|uniref:Uncharacterized protein n=1 Tax=Botryobasidium botryosum (strain FD-172 SS1) TaxID=930990 RepID=A0A067N1W4_BOTB1|nr:hypothetical protein BOTBODRAFT_322990 [Botryobasidium botryosum FD-172 SS1]